MIDPHRLLQAYQKARRELLAERVPEGHWVGELSASALSTATAVSALALMAKHTADQSRRDACRQIIPRGIQWLLEHQNDDGGWGDTDKSFSNIATTMLVEAAFHLADVAEQYNESLDRARHYLNAQGGIPALRQRYGVDKTFAVPILTNCALAGLVPWKKVGSLPFELACFPYPLLKFLRLPVVSYAVPALVAVGQARFFHRRPRNPLAWLVRRLSVGKSLKALQQMQPASGGYLEAIPLTSFVVMSLAGSRRADHPVARRGARFLLGTIRSEGAWPIDVNLATWNTSQSVGALAAATGDVGALGCIDWLLSCQHRQLHPFTHAEPGGWGWSDLSGAVPDVDDTSAALLALSALWGSSPQAKRQRIEEAARAGAAWLLGLQNDDGGWPTFCRGWGRLPFDRSGEDLTAHALRALWAWRATADDPRLEQAVARGFTYLARQQRSDGSWTPLWFGNQFHPREENPVYGTGRVLLAYRDLDRLDDPAARRGLGWLAANRNPDGGWGGSGLSVPRPATGGVSSSEETALAVEALLAASEMKSLHEAASGGMGWLIEAVESSRYRETAPIGLYFAKLWYYEKLYPLMFTVSALGRAIRQHAPPTTDTEVDRLHDEPTRK